MSTQCSSEEVGQSRQNVAGTSNEQRRAVPTGRIILIGVGFLTLAIGFYLLMYRKTGNWQTLIDEASVVLAIVGLTVACWLVCRKKFDICTIRARLLVGFVLMALLPAIAISAGSITVGYYNGRQQALDRLESVAALKELEISTWMHSLQNELVVALTEEYALDRARVVLDLARDNKYYDLFNKAMRYRFQWLVEQSQQLEELFLLDLQGRVVLSTDVAQEGKNYSDQAYFQQGLTGPYVQLPFNSASQDRTSVIVVIPVASNEGQLLGVMAGRASVEMLNGILRKRTGLGRTGKTYLVDLNHVLLTESHLSSIGSGFPVVEQRHVYATGIDTAVENQVNGSAVYDDYRGVRVVGVYCWLPELQVALLAEQDLSEAFRAIYATLGINVSIALASVLLAVGASLLITRSIATPLVNLLNTATQIAAGDLERVAKVQREDEVGALAQAFNSMTAQLHNLINSLEQRVAERTRALQEANQALRRRALQLETSARVSREITSILYIDDLLSRVVELIRDAFGYYHVHIFLIDNTERLVLRASSGAVGPQFQCLEIGSGSLNGEAAQANEALLVNDVAQDPRYLADEHLPDTRSEVVVPLRVGHQVLGTLDVQSVEVNAFALEDVLVIQSLGDQIAIAIENARLYDRSRALAILEERHRLARELHDSVTQSLFSLDLYAKAIATYLKRDPQQAEVQTQQLRQITHDTLQEMRSLIFDLRPSPLEDIGLVPALRQQIERLRRPGGPELVLHATGERGLPVEVEQDLFRIAQEALSNAVKHAGARHIVVELTVESERVTLCVTDDGRGFDPALLPADSRAFGLIGMRERTESLNGSFEIVSRPDTGTQVKVCVTA